MGKLAIEFTYTIPFIIALDLIWLGLIAAKFYKKEMGTMMRKKANWYAAIPVYILLTLGIVVFIPNPSSYETRFLYGALFGIVLYGVYECTNLALVKNWPLKMALVDIVWGGILCGLTALGSYYVGGILYALAYYS